MYADKHLLLFFITWTFTACVISSPQKSTSSALQSNPTVITTGEVFETQTPIIHAESCSANHVQEALNKANDGNIVFIPPGQCDWARSATVSRKAGIWLKGAGKGATVIKRSAQVFALSNGNPPAQEFLIEFNCSNGKKVEVSDLSFVGNDDLQSEAERLKDQDNGLSLKNDCQDFKIHDSTFSKFSQAGITIKGNSRGVIYSNEFISNFKCQASPVSCLGYGIAVYGNGVWDSTPLSSQLGSANAVFIEWNYFEDNRHAIASNNASKYVVRYNQIASTQRTRNFGPIDAHGLGSSSRGSRSWEIYQNTLIDLTTTHKNTTSISMRGGDGVIYSNQVPSSFAWVFSLNTESTCSSANYPLKDQTLEAYAWDNQVSSPTLPYFISSPACIKLNLELKQQKPAWYKAYPYPHPLRNIPL